MQQEEQHAKKNLPKIRKVLKTNVTNRASPKDVG